MDFATFAAIVDDFEAGTPQLIDAEQAFDMLSVAREHRMPLSPPLLAYINAAVSHRKPDGYELYIEPYEGRFRVIVKKEGKLLPSESGDNTP